MATLQAIACSRRCFVRARRARRAAPATRARVAGIARAVGGRVAAGWRGGPCQDALASACRPYCKLVRTGWDRTSLGRPSCIKEAACTAYEIRPSRILGRDRDPFPARFNASLSLSPRARTQTLSEPLLLSLSKQDSLGDAAPAAFTFQSCSNINCIAFTFPRGPFKPPSADTCQVCFDTKLP